MRVAPLTHLCLLAMLSLPALAEQPDRERVSMLAGSCANCHGTEGRLSGAVPPLAGRSAELLEQQLLAFKHDEDTHATVMDRIAGGYSDEELSALAEYFANIAPEDE